MLGRVIVKFQWFSSIDIFCLEGVSYDTESLELKLKEKPFEACSALHPVSCGFVPPLDLGEEDKESPLVLGQQGCMLFCLQIQEKILPSSVVREHALERIKSLEKISGKKISRDERLSIKDDVQFALLKQAFHKTKKVFAYIDTKNQNLIINSCHKKTLDLFIDHLPDDLFNSKISRPEYKNTSSLLTSWLQDNSFKNNFQPVDHTLLEIMEDKKSTIQVANKDVLSPSIQKFLEEGAYVMKLRLQWSNHIQFDLKQPFTLTRIRFLDDVKDIAKDASHNEDAAGSYLASFFIMTETLSNFIEDLLASFSNTEQTNSVNNNKVLSE